MSDWTGEDRRIRAWHLKREINLGLIGVLLGQLATSVWYVADFNAWRAQATVKLAEHDRLITESIAPCLEQATGERNARETQGYVVHIHRWWQMMEVE